MFSKKVISISQIREVNELNGTYENKKVAGKQFVDQIMLIIILFTLWFGYNEFK